MQISKGMKHYGFTSQHLRLEREMPYSVHSPAKIKQAANVSIGCLRSYPQERKV